MNIDIIKQALKNRYPSNNGEWILLFEVRSNTGFSFNSPDLTERYIDAIALNCYPSEKFKRIAFEIKTSRQDFLKEIKSPMKRLRSLLYFNFFYFVTPKGLLQSNEIPLGYGLLEVVESGTIKVTVKAHEMEASPFPDSFLMSIIRNAYLQGKNSQNFLQTDAPVSGAEKEV